ncbi:MAG: hypothetical protein IJM27_08085 [Eubacterium sp.]|nr:hypothetical protein [Eubacterium sp.]
MDKKLHTPEEEAYLRMMDQEVPDLWNRIEAGLDRSEQNMSREERFLASQEGEILSFEQGAAKKHEKNEKNKKAKIDPAKKKQIGLILGAVAAAVIIIASALIFGLSRTQKKGDSAQENMDISGTANMEQQAEQTNQAAKSDQAEKGKKGTAQQYSINGKSGSVSDWQASDDTLNLMGGGSAAQKEETVPANEADEPQDSREESGAIQGESNESKSEEKKAEEEKEAVDSSNRGWAKDGTVVNPGLLPGGTGDLLEEAMDMILPDDVDAKTLGELADMESPESIAIVYRMKDGTPVSYRIFTRDATDEVQILEKSIYDSDLTMEQKDEKAIPLSEDTPLIVRDDIVSGQKVFFLQ